MFAGTIWVTSESWGLLGDLVIHTANVLSLTVFGFAYIGPGLTILRKR